MIGISELLLISNLTKQQIEFTTIIKEAGISLTSIMQDILDFTMIDAGKVNITHSNFSLRYLIESSICEFCQSALSNIGLLFFNYFIILLFY